MGTHGTQISKYVSTTTYKPLSILPLYFPRGFLVHAPTTPPRSAGTIQSAAPPRARLRRLVLRAHRLGGLLERVLHGLPLLAQGDLLDRHLLAAEREDAVRGKYSDQREKVQSELERLAAAPKAPVARAGYEVMTDAGFSPAMKERGYTDNVAGLRALAREAGREMKADRKETRSAARARLAKPRVEAALREKLYGRRGPEQVEG